MQRLRPLTEKDLIRTITKSGILARKPSSWPFGLRRKSQRKQEAPIFTSAASATQPWYSGTDSVHIFLHGLGDEWKPQGKAREAETERGKEEIHLAWAYSYAELPTWCEAVIPADKAPVLLGWWQMITRHALARHSNDCISRSSLWMESIRMTH